MTRKGLGMTTVVGVDGRLVGVITDGDLRRLHLRGDVVRHAAGGSGGYPRGPRTIGADDLAAKALEMMEGKITSLIVVDESQGPVVSFTYTTSSARRSSSLFSVFLFRHPRGRDRVVLKLHGGPHA